MSRKKVLSRKLDKIHKVEKESNYTHLPSADLFEAQAKTNQLQHELEGALHALEKSQCCSPST
ncbi:unnamed protein product [Rhodiola kirilowii]